MLLRCGSEKKITSVLMCNAIFYRNLRRYTREDPTSVVDDVADPVLSEFSTTEIVRIIDLIDKIQNAQQQSSSRANVDLTAEEARTLRYLMNAYAK